MLLASSLYHRLHCLVFKVHLKGFSIKPFTRFNSVIFRRWYLFATAVYLWYIRERKLAKLTKFGGPKWTRTTDLTLIRRAL